jgi:hypothetical protein
VGTNCQPMSKSSNSPPTKAPYPFLFLFSPRSSSDNAYLIFHNRLLKPRPNHSLLAGRLAPAPDALAVGCLHGTHLLAGLYALLQDLVHAALGRRRGGIGGRDGGARLAGFGVVGRDRVGVGGAVGAAQGWHAPGDGAEGS